MEAPSTIGSGRSSGAGEESGAGSLSFCASAATKGVTNTGEVVVPATTSGWWLYGIGGRDVAAGATVVDTTFSLELKLCGATIVSNLDETNPQPL